MTEKSQIIEKSTILENSQTFGSTEIIGDQQEIKQNLIEAQVQTSRQHFESLKSVVPSEGGKFHQSNKSNSNLIQEQQIQEDDDVDETSSLSNSQNQQIQGKESVTAAFQVKNGNFQGNQNKNLTSKPVPHTNTNVHPSPLDKQPYGIKRDNSFSKKKTLPLASSNPKKDSNLEVTTGGLISPLDTNIVSTLRSDQSSKNEQPNLKNYTRSTLLQQNPKNNLKRMKVNIRSPLKHGEKNFAEDQEQLNGGHSRANLPGSRGQTTSIAETIPQRESPSQVVNLNDLWIKKEFSRRAATKSNCTGITPSLTKNVDLNDFTDSVRQEDNKRQEEIREQNQALNSDNSMLSNEQENQGKKEEIQVRNVTKVPEKPFNPSKGLTDLEKEEIKLQTQHLQVTMNQLTAQQKGYGMQIRPSQTWRSFLKEKSKGFAGRDLIKSPQDLLYKPNNDAKKAVTKPINSNFAPNSHEIFNEIKQENSNQSANTEQEFEDDMPIKMSINYQSTSDQEIRDAELMSRSLQSPLTLAQASINSSAEKQRRNASQKQQNSLQCASGLYRGSVRKENLKMQTYQSDPDSDQDTGSPEKQATKRLPTVFGSKKSINQRNKANLMAKSHPMSPISQQVRFRSQRNQNYTKTQWNQMQMTNINGNFNSTMQKQMGKTSSQIRPNRLLTNHNQRRGIMLQGNSGSSFQQNGEAQSPFTPKQYGHANQAHLWAKMDQQENDENKMQEETGTDFRQAFTAGTDQRYGRKSQKYDRNDFCRTLKVKSVDFDSLQSLRDSLTNEQKQIKNGGQKSRKISQLQQISKSIEDGWNRKKERGSSNDEFSPQENTNPILTQILNENHESQQIQNSLNQNRFGETISRFPLNQKELEKDHISSFQQQQEYSLSPAKKLQPISQQRRRNTKRLLGANKGQVDGPNFQDAVDIYRTHVRNKKSGAPPTILCEDRQIIDIRNIYGKSVSTESRLTHQSYETTFTGGIGSPPINLSSTYYNKTRGGFQRQMRKKNFQSTPQQQMQMQMSVETDQRKQLLNKQGVKVTRLLQQDLQVQMEASPGREFSDVDPLSPIVNSKLSLSQLPTSWQPKMDPIKESSKVSQHVLRLGQAMQQKNQPKEHVQTQESLDLDDEDQQSKRQKIQSSSQTNRQNLPQTQHLKDSQNITVKELFEKRDQATSGLISSEESKQQLHTNIVRNNQLAQHRDSPATLMGSNDSHHNQPTSILNFRTLVGQGSKNQPQRQDQNRQSNPPRSSLQDRPLLVNKVLSNSNSNERGLQVRTASRGRGGVRGRNSQKNLLKRPAAAGQEQQIIESHNTDQVNNGNYILQDLPKAYHQKPVTQANHTDPTSIIDQQPSRQKGQINTMQQYSTFSVQQKESVDLVTTSQPDQLSTSEVQPVSTEMRMQENRAQTHMRQQMKGEIVNQASSINVEDSKTITSNQQMALQNKGAQTGGLLVSDATVSRQDNQTGFVINQSEEQRMTENTEFKSDDQGQSTVPANLITLNLSKNQGKFGKNVPQNNNQRVVVQVSKGGNPSTISALQGVAFGGIGSNIPRLNSSQMSDKFAELSPLMKPKGNRNEYLAQRNFQQQLEPQASDIIEGPLKKDEVEKAEKIVEYQQVSVHEFDFGIENQGSRLSRLSASIQQQSSMGSPYPLDLGNTSSSQQQSPQGFAEKFAKKEPLKRRKSPQNVSPALCLPKEIVHGVKLNLLVQKAKVFSPKEHKKPQQTVRQRGYHQAKFNELSAQNPIDLIVATRHAKPVSNQIQSQLFQKDKLKLGLSFKNSLSLDTQPAPATHLSPSELINGDTFQIKKLQESDQQKVVSLDLKQKNFLKMKQIQEKKDDLTHKSGMGAQTTPGLTNGNYANEFLHDHNSSAAQPDWNKNFYELSLKVRAASLEMQSTQQQPLINLKQAQVFKMEQAKQSTSKVNSPKSQSKPINLAQMLENQKKMLIQRQLGSSGVIVSSHQKLPNKIMLTQRSIDQMNSGQTLQSLETNSPQDFVDQALIATSCHFFSNKDIANQNYTNNSQRHHKRKREVRVQQSRAHHYQHNSVAKSRESSGIHNSVPKSRESRISQNTSNINKDIQMSLLDPTSQQLVQYAASIQGQEQSNLWQQNFMRNSRS